MRFRFTSLSVGIALTTLACAGDKVSTGGGGSGGVVTGSGGKASGTNSSSHVTSTVGTGATSTTSTGQGGATPIPIQHVIVIVKENHTFDNYFGSFPGAEGNTMCKLKNGTTFTCPGAPDSTPRDMCHQHSCALTDWAGGQMNRWEDVAGSDSGGDHLAWAQYSEADIPNYWAYAKKYALADHFFANVLGPSFPGHLFTLAAQAGWATGNPPTDLTSPYWGCDEYSSDTLEVLDKGTCATKNVFPCFKIPSVPTVLPAGVTWKFYGSHFYILPEVWSMFDAIDGIRNTSLWNQIVTTDQFLTDIQNHTLPNVTWLVNQDLNDEHPNIGSVCKGENWTVSNINALMQSDYWKSSVILFTMDDFGGWYDHVPPPRQYGCDGTNPYGLGFRLPLIIMSPYVKPGFIFKEQSEQASIPRFIEKVFNAPALSTIDPAAQDGQANDLMNAFDWNQLENQPLVLQQRTCP